MSKMYFGKNISFRKVWFKTNPGSCRRQSGCSHFECSEIRRGFGGGLGPGLHRTLRTESLLRHQFFDIFSEGIFGLPQGDVGR